MKHPAHLILLIATLLPIGHNPSLAATNSSESSSDSFKNRADFLRAMKELSNWGRWGTNDQLGALNLVTPSKRKQALALAQHGESVSLARNVDKITSSDNGSPFQHIMDRVGTNNPGFSSADTFKISYHGMAHTHIDSLCHMFHDGRMYNGFPQSSVTTLGAEQLGILTLKDGVLSRGILMDIPSLKGIPFLEPGTPIYPQDLEAWETKVNIRVTAGDVVFIRTGRWARRYAKGPWSGSFAGLHASCAYWLKQRDVAMLGSDAASDVLPSGVNDVAMPIHQLCLVAMGTWILDNCDLEALSTTAKERQRWEFMLHIAPLAVPGATGSPINPIATF